MKQVILITRIQRVWKAGAPGAGQGVPYRLYEFARSDWPKCSGRKGVRAVRKG